jgi:hypothetical protein
VERDAPDGFGTTLGCPPAQLANSDGALVLSCKILRYMITVLGIDGAVQPQTRIDA